MPTYEYRCDCGCRFVQTRSIKEDTGWQKCPKCGHDAKVLVTGGATTIFSGANWPGKQVRMQRDTQKILRDGAGVLKEDE